MKILFASSVRGWGGGEHWLLEAATDLRARGHAVHLAPRQGTALEQAARRRGLAVHAVPYGGLLDPRPSLLLERLLARHGIEVVLANLERELWHTALAATAHPEVALVNRRGSPIPIRADARRRWLYGRVRAVLVNAETAIDSIYARGGVFPRERVHVVENGWDAPLREPRPSPHDWPVGPGARLVAVGTLDANKNPLGLLRALATVRTPWRLLWVGRGPLAGAFDQLAGSLGVAARVRRLGFASDAWRWTAAADLFVHFASEEGQSWAVLEALAAATPTVVTRASGWGTFVDGSVARVVEAGDEAAFAAAVEELVGSPDVRRELGRAAAERARLRQSRYEHVLGLERLLERVRWEARGQRPAVFLDRDGTLTPELGALGDPERLRLLAGVGEGLRTLAHAGFECIVVTNQAAVGRGLLPLEAVDRVQARLRELVRREGVELAALYQCPHRPEDGCACRKPGDGLWRQAETDLGVRMRDAWTIGDSSRDILAGRRAGTRTILLASGWGGADPGAAGVQAVPDARASSLAQAAHLVAHLAGPPRG